MFRNLEFVRSMKTIKIFLASSEELSDDRNAFGNLVRRLDKMYEKRGLRIDLFEWEDCDAAYNGRRKQNEYNDEIKASDMFLALFHIKAGEGTIEEFDVATEEFQKHASPKVYVYCKDLKPEEQESQELKEFKRKLTKDFGHYWCRYGNRDSMQLHFVMQLQLVETSGIVDKLKAEEGLVFLETMPIAKMDNLQFAAGNTTYQRMSSELAEMPEQIKKARERATKYPNDVDLQDELQQKLNNYNKLKDEFAQMQNALLETALHITVLQQGRVSEMLRRAIDAFDVGNLEKANMLLDEIALEAEQHMKQLDKQRELVHQDIDAFRVQAKTVMADVNYPINERIEKTNSIYIKADEWAQKSSLPHKKYEELLNDYGTFLYEYGEYGMALEVYQRLLSILEKTYGAEHPKTAATYKAIGNSYSALGDYKMSLRYLINALKIHENFIGKPNQQTASYYNDLGLAYNNLGDYENALIYYSKALDILLESNKILSNLIVLYNNLSMVICNMGDYNQAFMLLSKALFLGEKYLGAEHNVVIATYNNIANVYAEQGNYDKALEYSLVALSACKKTLGEKHPNTAAAYNNTGGMYNKKKDYDKALNFHSIALDICEKQLGTDHPNTASTYNCIGDVYLNQGDYVNAVKNYYKAYNIRKMVLGEKHPETINSYSNIAVTFWGVGRNEEALKFLLRAQEIREDVLGPEHPDSAFSYNRIANVYFSQEKYEESLVYYLKAMTIYEKVFGNEHLITATSYNNIGSILFLQKDYAKALEYYLKALVVCEKILGPNHNRTITTYENIANVYSELKDDEKAQEYKQKALMGKQKDQQ